MFITIASILLKTVRRFDKMKTRRNQIQQDDDWIYPVSHHSLPSLWKVPLPSLFLHQSRVINMQLCHHAPVDEPLLRLAGAIECGPRPKCCPPPPPPCGVGGGSGVWNCTHHHAHPWGDGCPCRASWRGPGESCCRCRGCWGRCLPQDLVKENIKAENIPYSAVTQWHHWPLA